MATPRLSAACAGDKISKVKANRGRKIVFMSQSIAEQPELLNPQSDDGKPHITVIHGDLLSEKGIDAFVSFLTEDLSWGGPVNQQILAITGPQLDEYVLNHDTRLLKGKSFSTPSFGIKSNALIFAVISEWDDGFSGAERFLKLAIMSSLQLAEEMGIKTIAFPSLGSEAEGFPLARSARIFFNALADSPLDAFDEIRIVCKSDAAFEEYKIRLEEWGD